MSVEKVLIGEGVFLLKNPKFPGCNSLLIEGERTALVDTGLGIGRMKNQLKEIKIDVLINSHTHPDHVAANHLVSEMSDADIYVPEQEKGSTISLHQMEKSLGVLGKNVAPSWEEIVKNEMGFKESAREIVYGDGRLFDFGTVQLKAVHTPGHSPGHYCFLIQPGDLLFVSDLGLDSFGPWYGYLNSDLDVFYRSIEKTKKIGVKRVLSSHYDSVYDNLNKELNRCLEIIKERENKILTFLKEGPKSSQELARLDIVYRNLSKFQNPMKEFLTFFEENMINEHLRVLERSGRVFKQNGCYAVLNNT